MLYKNCSFYFKDYSAAYSFIFPKKLVHVLIRSLTAFTQVINKQLRATIGNKISIFQTNTRFYLTINQYNYRLIGLRRNLMICFQTNSWFFMNHQLI